MLTTPDLKRVREVFLESFKLSDIDGLMLDIGKRRELFGLGDDLREIVRKVVDAGDREGWLHQLLRKAAAANPEVAEELAAAGILDRLGALAADRSELFETYYFRRRPLVDHEDLRPMLRSLYDDTDEGARILIVRGERYSGKSYTIDFIHHLSNRLGFHVNRVELLKHAAGRELTPDIVARAIVDEMKLPEPMPEVGHDQMAWWTTHYLSWLVRILRESDGVWWIVLDDFHHLTVPPAVYEFIEEMALKIDGALQSIRLVLIGFDRPLPEKVEPIVETYTTGPITEAHLADYFTRFVRDYVGTTTLGEAPALVAESVKMVRDVMNQRDARGRLVGMSATVAKESQRLRGNPREGMIRPLRWTDAESADVRTKSLQLLDRMIPAPAVIAPEATRYSAAHEAAAVVSTFRIDAASRAGDREEVLLRDALQLPDASGEEWTLRPDVRMEVLRQLIAEGRLAKVLGEHRREEDPLFRALSSAVQGSPAFRDLDTASLGALLPLLPLFPDVSGSELQRRLELSRILDPFRHLVGTFRGRAQELSRLRRYVSVLAPGSVLEKFSRALNVRQERPFLVVGPGGVGKSTLIARFILDHLQQDAERFPFAYIDYDRPIAEVEEPATILLEVVRQIGYQYSEAGDAAERLRDSWSALFTSSLRQEASRTARIVRDFQAFLDTLSIRDRPLLLVLDTFEEIHYRSPAYVRRLGALLDELRETIPRFRTVIASRAEVPGIQFSDVMRLGELDLDAALGFLVAKGIGEETVAREIVRQVGGHPLSLHLAAALFQQEGAFPAGEIPSKRFGIFTESRQLVQGLLYRRILGHIHDDEVRRLAHPGLVVRRVTPEVIRWVLAVPCGIDIRTDEHAQRLFDNLRNEIALVEVRGEDVLAFRSDVRSIALVSVNAADPERVRHIHSLAIDYYGKRDDDVSRAEEIYHRLSLGEPAGVVDERFTGDVLRYLKDAGEELPPQQKAYLSEKLGRDLTEEEWTSAELSVWERAAERQVHSLLATEDYERALKILRQRGDRSPATPLHLLETRALAGLGLLDQATQVAERGIHDYAALSESTLLFSMLESAAEIYLGLGNPAAAEERLIHAGEIARQLRDDHKRLRVLLARARVAESVRGEADPDLKESVLALALAMSPELLQSDQGMYRRLLLSMDDQVQVLGKVHEEALAAERRRDRANQGRGEGGLRLDPDGRSRMAEVLLQRFPQVDDFRIFLSDHLDRGLDSLTLAGSLRKRIIDVINIAQESEWLGDLLFEVRTICGPDALRSLDSFAPSFIPESNEASNALPSATIREYVSSSRMAFAAIEARLGRLEVRGAPAGSAWAVLPTFVLCASTSLGTTPADKIDLYFDSLAIGDWVRRGERYSVHHRFEDPQTQAAILQLKQAFQPADKRRLAGLDPPFQSPPDVRECLWVWHGEKGLRISGVQGVEDVAERSFVLPTAVPDAAAGAVCVDTAMNPIGILVTPGSVRRGSLVLRLPSIRDDLSKVSPA